MDFTREELERADLILVVDSEGNYKWCSAPRGGCLTRERQVRTELDRMREVAAISDALAGPARRGSRSNEGRRQDIARAGFDEVMGLGGRLANLVRCELCGLLDDQSPCGDHEEES